MSMPTLKFVVEPVLAGAIVFQPSAPVQAGASPTGRLLLSFYLTNTGVNELTMSAVKLRFPGSSVGNVVVPISPGVPLVIKAGGSAAYGFTSSDDIILPIPAPATVAIEVEVKGNPIGVSQTFPLRAFTDGPLLSSPFRAADLRDGEYIVTGRCSHGAGGFAGDQGFAYDIGVQYLGAIGGDERARLPGADNSKNTNSRIWGLPVYAMADGVVTDVVRDTPTNPDPPSMSTNLYDAGVTSHGGGNFVGIDHGNGYVAGLCHMQIGSLPAVLVKGAAVVRGQLLGRVGNSGRSSGPHIHIGAMNKGPNAELRPMVWAHGYVTGCGSGAVHPASPWAQLGKHGLPALSGDAETNARVAWWPDISYPSRFAPGRTEVVIAGIPDDEYQRTFNALAADGYHVHLVRTVQTVGALWFTIVARPASGNHVAFHHTAPSSYESMFHELVPQGYRLTCLHTYRTDQIRMAGVFRKVAGPGWFATGLHSAAQHQVDLAKAHTDGFFPTSLSVVVDSSGHELVSAIFEKGNVGAWRAVSMPLAAYQHTFDQASHAGQQLAALDAHHDPVQGEMFDAIFQATHAGGVAIHGLGLNDVAEQCHQRRIHGHLTQAIASYSQGGAMRFAGLWR
jgi:hypothetical protein